MLDVLFLGTDTVTTVFLVADDEPDKVSFFSETLTDGTVSTDDEARDGVRIFLVDVPTLTTFQVIKVVGSAPFSSEVGDLVVEDRSKPTVDA